MMTNAFLKFLVLLVALAFCTSSCNNSSESTESTFYMEIVTPAQLPTSVDSTVYYRREYVEWHTATGWQDTTSADSLARWFASSSFHITDMWFPFGPSICIIPLRPKNIVIIKLATPDTLIRRLGFSGTISFVNECIPIYRHYVFRGGT